MSLGEPLFLGLLTPAELSNLQRLKIEVGPYAARLYHDRLPAVAHERVFQRRLAALQTRYFGSPTT